MKELRRFTCGLALAFGIPWLLLVVLPWSDWKNLEPVAYGEEDEGAEAPAFPPGRAGRIAEGHRVYAQLGCAYCHTQMVRTTYAGTDLWRPGWGGREEEGLQRSTRPRDYLGEPYALLGVRRIGPDLSNVGWRIQEPARYYRHLYDPRIESPWSIMPSFQSLFERRRIESARSEVALDLPEGLAPPDGFEIVPTSEATALVQYLLSLRKDYKVPVALKKGASGGTPASSGETQS